MSVINKMLRDLDARSHPAAAAQQALPNGAPPALAAQAVAARPVAVRTGAYVLIGLATTLLVVLGTLVGWWHLGTNPTAGVVPVLPPPAAQAQVPHTTGVDGPGQPLPAADQVAVAESAAASQPEKPLKPSNKALAKAQPSTSSAPAIRTTVVAAAGTPPIAQASSAGASGSPVVATPAGAAEPAASTNRQIQGARDALLQAQVLWNAGSHDAALDLLQQALSLLERSGGSQGSASQTGLLAPVARELGRMLVAEGRPAAALDMLGRLEPALGREADIWALRGNAAQRLGRHQESVNAYALALQLRPNEQRWLLASAVSLAALGQTADATDMAAKAAAQGPVGKEVQAYLRQAGVRLAEP